MPLCGITETLSDVESVGVVHPLSGDIYDYIDNVQAKTYCQSFEEQLEIAEMLYGQNMRFCFSKKDIDRVLESVQFYDINIVSRVKDILLEQMRRYKYLFS